MPKNKILFINPPISCNKETKFSNFKLPLGFMYMADLLERNNFIVKILDCQLYYEKKREVDKETIKIGLYPEDIFNEVIQFSPDIVGISCAYGAYEQDSFEVINLVKKAGLNLKKRILIIVGGAHTSANPSYVLRNNNIDLAVIGEGELTMLDIAKNYYHGKRIDNIKGTALIFKNRFKMNKSREYIQNLDNLKPAYHLIDLERYFSHPDNSMATMRKRVVDIITSRGCPANCVFCSIHTVWGKKWRGRSPKNVVDEIEFLIKKYKIGQFRVQDDNLTFDRKRIMDICDEILKRGLNVKWDTPNGVAIWALDEEVIKKMKRAGCYRITFGIESGCDKTQRYIRKVLDKNKIKKFIDFCHKNRIWVCSTFIIGFPYETREDINQTLDFILNLKINFPFVYVAQPYMGTDLYEDFKKEHLLEDIKYTSNIKKSKYNTKHLSGEELNLIMGKIYKQFYLKTILRYFNPIQFYKEFLSKIRSLEDVRYIFKMMRAIIFDNK